MIFIKTRLPGAYIIEVEKIADERGYFARSWCRNEFSDHGLETALVQCNVSDSKKKGTLRGMHYQDPPYPETKLVRCTRGSIFDVMVDLRPDSPTFLKWMSEVLTPDNGRMMYVPKGFAHGFLTLEDDTMVSYQVSEFYAPEYYKGARWDDPLLKIEWPGEITTISERDQNWKIAHPDQFEILRGIKEVN